MNQIDNFPVVSIRGMPHIYAHQIALQAVAGIDGIQTWDLGERGDPFTVETLAIVGNHQIAQLLYEQYTTTITKSTGILILYGGRVLPRKFQVLGVRPLEIRAAILARSQIATGQGLCRAAWDLIAIDPSVQPV